ncbi:MAG: phosphatase PAP2 family protein [Bacteroides sp.]|nr:phosphatase PAP2 family protein [Roseburia sp.]MCM1346035.1 phosphatase PAP2 family protein [Bacteroides sp.]MCM1420196.1 phosphatase PAP2 family protein [Bacteroides sp.]
MDWQSLNTLDQHLTLLINGSNSLFWDNVMYTVTNTFSWTLVIIALLVIIFKNNNLKEAVLVVLTIGLLIFVADRVCSGWVKPTVARWRPTQDPQIMYLVDVVNGYRGGRFGFFSGHACNTFCVAMFLSWLFRSAKVTYVLFFWSATTTFTRLYLGVHYLGDVTVGLIIGCLLGFLFYVLMEYVHRRIGSKRLISEQFTSSGYLKSDMDAFLTVVFFNYICVVIFAVAQGF